MFDTKTDEDWISVALSSTDELVQKAVKVCDQFVRQRCEGSTDALRVVMRELLTVAVERSNGSDSELEVRCRVGQLAANRFKIEIETDGIGFGEDRDKNDPLTGLGSDRDHGLCEANALTDQLIFNDAQKGLTAYITVQTETDFAVEIEERGNVITPSGNLTAASAEPLRHSGNDAR